MARDRRHREAFFARIAEATRSGQSMLLPRRCTGLVWSTVTRPNREACGFQAPSSPHMHAAGSECSGAPEAGRRRSSSAWSCPTAGPRSTSISENSSCRTPSPRPSRMELPEPRLNPPATRGQEASWTSGESHANCLYYNTFVETGPRKCGASGS